MTGVRRLVALGDSFTAGGPETGERTWVEELARRLGAGDCHNLAVDGARTDAVAGEQFARALTLSPDLVTLVCGANDVLLSTRPQIGRYERQLARMFRQLRSHLPGAAVVTATMPDFSGFIGLRERSRGRVAAGLSRLNDATRRVAAQHRVLCVDLARHPGAADRASFAADGYHASAAAQTRVAKAFAAAIEQRLGMEPRPIEEVV